MRRAASYQPNARKSSFGIPEPWRNMLPRLRWAWGSPASAARRNGNPNAQFYMEWMALVVGWNQQALGRRLVAKDLEQQRVTHGVDRQPRRR